LSQQPRADEPKEEPEAEFLRKSNLKVIFDAGNDAKINPPSPQNLSFIKRPAATAGKSLVAYTVEDIKPKPETLPAA
jgi:hypothetical protein